MKEELIKLLKERLSVLVLCDYDRCERPQVHVSLYFDDEEISTSTDYLITQ